MMFKRNTYYATRHPHKRRDEAVKIQSLERSRRSRREANRRREQRVAATRIQKSARSKAAKKEAKQRRNQLRYDRRTYPVQRKERVEHLDLGVVTFRGGHIYQYVFLDDSG